ncbi:hypothetical protein A2U01_0114802, partial [Trifolium medium]|nr:hypothetical protein [Trifolium medium]
ECDDLKSCRGWSCRRMGCFEGPIMSGKGSLRGFLEVLVSRTYGKRSRAVTSRCA